MKNTLAVFIGGDEYICVQYYDIDNNIDGVEVFEASSNVLIGNILNMRIPDLDDSDYDELCILFNNEIELFLENNYF